MISKIISTLVPRPIIECVYDRYLMSKFSQLTAPNEVLKGVGRGKRAFLLATGPSIKLEDLTKLKGEDCYSVSNFFLHPDIKIINPKIHFFTPYHKPLILSNYLEWLKKADRELPRDTTICLGHTMKQLVETNKIFRKRKIYYLILSPVRQSVQLNIVRPILAPQTVPLMVLPLLIYMEYSKIYLLGCDHNALKDYGNRVTNFYTPSQEIRINATGENAWGNIIDVHEANIRLFNQYIKYLNLLDNSHINIINLSNSSWINFIKKKQLSDVLREPFLHI